MIQNCNSVVNPMKTKFLKLSTTKNKRWSQKKIGRSFTNLCNTINESIANLINLLPCSVERPLRFIATSIRPQSLEKNKFQESDKVNGQIATEAQVLTEAASSDKDHPFHFKNLGQPIILYGRLFEEEGFQYVSIIFGKRMFLIEFATDIFDIQERACETINSLIGRFGEASFFIKICGSAVHIVAEIDPPKRTLLMCQSVPGHLEILNLNEMVELIPASNFLINQSLPRIRCLYDETIFYKQLFIEGLYVNNNVFGCIDAAHINAFESMYPIVLVFCDTVTQSNFLWNNKPLTVNAKDLLCKFKASDTSYEQIKLQPMTVAIDSDKRGGVCFGDQIRYEGPLDVMFDINSVLS